MGRGQRKFLLAGLALAALVGGAVSHAGEVSESITNRNIAGPPGYVWDGTRWRRQTGNSDGATNTREVSPEYQQLWKYQSLLQSAMYPTASVIAGGTNPALKSPQADSSQAKNMLGANHMALAISYTLDDSTSMALLGVQVRGHYSENTDSLSTFVWNAWGPGNSRYTAQGTAATVRDSVGASANSSAGDANSGLTSGSSFMADSVNCLAGERPIWLNRTAPGQQRYLWIPLETQNGTPFSAPYVSIRWRIIRVYGASGVAYVAKQAPVTLVNADLIGWR